MGDGFYRSKDPTNSIKVLKETKSVKMVGDNMTMKNTLCHILGYDLEITGIQSWVLKVMFL